MLGVGAPCQGVRVARGGGAALADRPREPCPVAAWGQILCSPPAPRTECSAVTSGFSVWFMKAVREPKPPTMCFTKLQLLFVKYLLLLNPHYTSTTIQSSKRVLIVFINT